MPTYRVAKPRAWGRALWTFEMLKGVKRHQRYKEYICIYTKMWFQIAKLCAVLSLAWGNTIPSVKELDLEKYIGHWYQVYASPVDFTFQGYGKCITADYDIQGANNVSVLNSQLNKNDELEQIEGYAFYKDLTEPGQLSVHLDGVPVISPYWVVKLGDRDTAAEYTYSIITVPSGPSLWVLARNVSEFFVFDADEVGAFLDSYQLFYVKVDQENCPDVY